MERINIHAPAKINVGLNIVKKRDDGYHNLETIFYQIHDLFDVLIFEKSDKLELHLSNENQDLANDNIIIKAVKLLEQKVNKSLNVKIKTTRKDNLHTVVILFITLSFYILYYLLLFYSQ